MYERPACVFIAPRWSTRLGIPEEDMEAWGDSCPKQAGYDELGNFMTYVSAVCYAALGHITPGQVGAARGSALVLPWVVVPLPR